MFSISNIGLFVREWARVGSRPRSRRWHFLFFVMAATHFVWPGSYLPRSSSALWFAHEWRKYLVSLDPEWLFWAGSKMRMHKVFWQPICKSIFSHPVQTRLKVRFPDPRSRLDCVTNVVVDHSCDLLAWAKRAEPVLCWPHYSSTKSKDNRRKGSSS